MGPLVSAGHRERVANLLDHGVGQGGRVLTGGHAVLGETGGSFFAPTIVTDLAPDNVLVQEEVFGPVLSVQVVDSEQEAVRVAGNTPYGLAAGLWTADLGTAHRVSRALRAGTVWVNCYEAGDMNVPFGGVKLSGFGRDKSRHALDEYTDLKTTWIRYG
jgi:gamma-glutamyl-gamma-aminobutyraldehyde dehydrogenase